MLLLVTVATAYLNSLAGGIRHIKLNKPVLTDSILSVKNQYQLSAIRDMPKKVFAGNCYDINWATWSTFSDVSSTTGSIIDADGSQIGITMAANYTFGSTPSIYTFSRFSGYPASIPNSTVPKTTWSAGTGGSTDMCFSKKVTNPVLLLSSLGSTQPTSSQLKFSIPYVVLYDGGGMVYNDSKTITGTEGYAIIMFPGEFNCVNIQSNTPENYTNLTWGIRPQPFAVTITDNSSTCGSTKVTASGGASYHWDGGDTPNQAANTFHQSGTYLVTVTNASGCVTSASKTIVVSTTIAPVISAFSIPQQSTPAVLDAVNKKITITMPYGTDLTTLRPIVTVPANATVSPASGAVVNFINPVNYTITNSCAQVSYMVTVKIDNTIPITQRLACPADAVLLNGDVLATPPDSYSWQIMQAGVWVNTTGSINQSDYTATAPANLTGADIVLDYRRAVTKGGNIVYDSFYKLTVQRTTSNSIISADRTQFCAGDINPLTLTGNQPNGFTFGDAYTWQQSPDGVVWTTIINSNAQNILYGQYINADKYFRRVTNMGICPAYSNTLKITFTGTGTTAIAGTNIEGCQQVQPLPLHANTPAVGEIGTWSIASSSGYNPFTALNEHNPNTTISNIPLDEDIQLTWTILKSSCMVSSSATISLINHSPGKITSFNVSNQVAGTIIDQNGLKITIKVAPNADLSSLATSIGATNGYTLSPNSGATQNFSSPIVYTLSNACSQLQYTVNVIKLTAHQIDACPETDITLAGEGASQASISYRWQISQTNGWQNAAGNNNSFSYTGVLPANYSGGFNVLNYRRMLTDQSGNVEYDSYYNIILAPTTTQNSIAASQATGCIGQITPIVFTGNQPTGYNTAMTYKWEQSTDQQNWTTITNQTGQNYIFNGIVSQRLYFRRATISITCTALSNVAVIETGNTVTASNAGPNQGDCNMQQAHLNANLPMQYETGTWTVLSPSTYNPFNNSNMHDPKAVITNIPADVDVKLRWRIANNVCLQYTESEVTMRNQSLPEVFAGNDVFLELGNSIVLHPQINALPGYTVQWTPSASLSTNNFNELVATPTETTRYKLAVTSVAGCESVSYINVNVKNDLVIPNSITPNGDGVNDIWNIKNIYAYKGISVSVFTRWGQQVFYSSGYAKPWDGTHNGKRLSAGVYYYIIKTDDSKVKKAGSVTIIY